MRKKLQKLLALFLILTVTWQTVSVGAVSDKMNWIRVGLTNSFKEKSSLTIAEKQVVIGYSVFQQYKKSATLYSETGFVFTPATGYYARSSKVYKDYEAAKSIAKSIKENYQVDTFVGLSSSEEIRVWIGGQTKAEELTKAIDKVQGVFGNSFESVGVNPKQFMKIIGSQDAVISDGTGANGYVQVAPLTAETNLTLGTKPYRGRLEIGCYGKNSVTAVNVISIEPYLYGVVAAEMPASWHKEALKAQAVVARTYALHKAGFTADSNIQTPYILNDTTSSQVYRGVLGETDATTKAVDETRGQYICYKGETIDATFFSTSGGATANSEDVWAYETDYLKAVSDIWELEPEKKPWLLTFTKETIQSKLSAKGQAIGTVLHVVEDGRTDSGYLSSVLVEGSSKVLNLQKETIRSYFGTPSTKFKIVEAFSIPDQVTIQTSDGVKKDRRISDCTILSANGAKNAKETTMEQFIVSGNDKFSNYPKQAPDQKGTYYFAGMGYGHGVGMSQSGAKGMAQEGYSYREIIKHYYTGTTIEQK